MGKVPSGTYISSPTPGGSNDGLILNIQRLKREVRVWREVLHPNVVALLGWTSQVVRDTIRVSLISTWCNGGHIKQYLRHNPSADRYALVRFVSISVASRNVCLCFHQIKGVCGGLAYLHSRGIVHGDIKPVRMRFCRPLSCQALLLIIHSWYRPTS